MVKSPRFAVDVSRPAQRSLRSLRKDRHLLGRIDRAIRALALEPRPSGCKKLVGKQFDNLYRIRVGDWRILYAIEDDRLIVLILDVVRRDQAYRAR
ncbi:MAG: type II toxin-antitoxin system RelE/ParE family toxin [Chloroflexi bacterium]|nr:type II toxin-antitoxin system RelE/ParE family toxin [Chloroflexota bacterium]